MSHEDADAEQDTCCRDDLAHSFPPCLTGESSTGSFPDDFAELGKWFRRPGRRSAMSYWQGGLAFRSPKGPAGSSWRVLLAQCRDRSSTVAIVIAKESNVASGTVKWFNGQKGYGFIAPDTGGKDVFVHISAVEKAGYDGLPDGAKVTFDVVPNRGKESAENLRLK